MLIHIPGYKIFDDIEDMNRFLQENIDRLDFIKAEPFSFENRDKQNRAYTVTRFVVNFYRRNKNEVA